MVDGDVFLISLNTIRVVAQVVVVSIRISMLMSRMGYLLTAFFSLDKFTVSV